MTTLPSFDELVSTLGVDATTRPRRDSITSRRSSRSISPNVFYSPISSPTRSKSSESLREPAQRHSSRYSPYSPSQIRSSRRGSLSSVSSSSSSSDSDYKVHDLARQSQPPRRRRRENKLTVNVFGSSTDLSANTPISIYVRRKTPGASPTSPAFTTSRDSSPSSTSSSPMPFMLPTLPTALSANSERFPSPGDVDAKRPALMDLNSHVQASRSASPHSKGSGKTLSDMFEGVSLARHVRRHTGVRISAPYSPPLSPRPRTIHVE